jgi:tRNA nucleotidyltransferase (CCA-adding enzyme)
MTNSNNIESMETVEIQITPITNEMVDTEMVGETDELKQETKALIEAMKRRAQAEAESAGSLTRETYLNAVRKARETIEGERLIEREKIESSLNEIQQEAEKNWHLLMKQFTEVGLRFQDAAKAAWDAFNAPRAS